jgi:acid phosphatase type 7
MAPSLSRAAALVAGAALCSPVVASTPRSLGDDCTKDIEPFQVRLSYFNATSMGVSWNTNASLSNPTVYFGTGSTLDQSASSSISVTYPSSSTWSNHVVITGLTPNTRYHYEPSCGHRGFSFTTAREVGDGHSFKFAMVGDMGTFGPDGLSTTVGTGAKNPLKPGDTTTVDALHNAKTGFDFLWHGEPLLLRRPSLLTF